MGHPVQVHEQSQSHMITCEVYLRWKVEMTVDSPNLEAIIIATDYWWKVLRRIVNIITTLATNNLVLREHRLIDGEILSKGNFLEIIYLLARYDAILAHLIQRPKVTQNI